MQLPHSTHPPHTTSAEDGTHTDFIACNLLSSRIDYCNAVLYKHASKGRLVVYAQTILSALITILMPGRCNNVLINVSLRQVLSRRFTNKEPCTNYITLKGWGPGGGVKVPLYSVVLGERLGSSSSSSYSFIVGWHTQPNKKFYHNKQKYQE